METHCAGRVHGISVWSQQNLHPPVPANASEVWEIEEMKGLSVRTQYPHGPQWEAGSGSAPRAGGTGSHRLADRVLPGCFSLPSSSQAVPIEPHGQRRWQHKTRASAGWKERQRAQWVGGNEVPTRQPSCPPLSAWRPRCKQ